MVLPEIEFELVDVDITNTSRNSGCNSEDQNEEFEFPLFSLEDETSKQNSNNQDNKSQDVSRARLIKVSLKEHPLVIAKNERPKDYYFSSYSEERQREFDSVAVEYSDILKEALMTDKPNMNQFKGKLIDVGHYNRSIALETSRYLRMKRKRPGKNQRMARKIGQKHNKEREERIKEIKKMVKKKFHKRGGKKNKRGQMKSSSTIEATKNHRNMKK